MNCRRCGRPLTDAVSRARGYGPDCDPHPERRRRISWRWRRGLQIGPDLLELLIMDGEDQHNAN